MVNSTFLEIQPVNRVPFSQCQPHLVSRKVNGTWPVQWRTGDLRTVRRRLTLTRAGKSDDFSTLHIHPPDAVVPNVTNIKMPFGPKLDAVWRFQARFGRQPSIARKARLSTPGNSAYKTRLGIHPPHQMIAHFHKEHVSRVVKPHLIGLIQLRLDGWASVPVIAFFACACSGTNTPILHPSDTVVKGVADVKCPIRASHEAKRRVYPGIIGQAAIAAVTLFTGTSKGTNGGRRKASCKQPERRHGSR